MTKAVIFDLDGTLAASKQAVTPEMGEALGKLLDKMPVAVISGGALHQFENQFLQFLPTDSNLNNLFLFPTSGGECYVFGGYGYEWQIKYSHAFTSEEKDKVLDAIQKSIEEINFQKPEKIYGQQLEDRGAQITFSVNGQDAPIEVKENYDPDRKKREPLAESLRHKLPDFYIGVNAFNSIDITRKGVTKAYGIEQFSKIINIPISEMIYVGDALFAGGNDDIVHTTGIATKEVSGPDDSLEFIKTLI